VKQKYVIIERKDTLEVLIREYAELEKEEFAFICEEIYKIDDLKAAAKEDFASFVTYLRRPNMYPKQEYAETIAQSVIAFISSENVATTTEVVFENVEVFAPKDNLVDERLR
jgi:hypothetical protein